MYFCDHLLWVFWDCRKSFVAAGSKIASFEKIWNLTFLKKGGHEKIKIQMI